VFGAAVVVMLRMVVGGGSFLEMIFGFGKTDFEFSFWERLFGLRKHVSQGIDRFRWTVEFADLDWRLVCLRLNSEIFGFRAEKVVSHFHLQTLLFCFKNLCQTLCIHGILHCFGKNSFKGIVDNFFKLFYG
jgi:hypothetical protein